MSDVRRFTRASGVLVEPMGHLWAAFSPTTNETLLLNNEAAAILEVLDEGPASTKMVCSCLTADLEADIERVIQTVEACWPRLIESGLVREHHLQCRPA